MGRRVDRELCVAPHLPGTAIATDAERTEAKERNYNWIIRHICYLAAGLYCVIRDLDCGQCTAWTRAESDLGSLQYMGDHGTRIVRVYAVHGGPCPAGADRQGMSDKSANPGRDGDTCSDAILEH